MSLDNQAAPAAIPPAGGARRPGYAGTLVAACVAVFVAQVVYALAASLNGLFQEDLHAEGAQLTWITSGTMVAVVVFEFSFGAIGDLFGRKKLVAAGAVLLAIGCVVFATAPNVQVVWVGAVLNGIGVGAMFPGSLAMAASATRSNVERARVVAIWAGFLGVGAAVSPLAGGVFAQMGSWRGSLWLMVGLSIVSLIVTLVLAKESSAPEGRGLDIPGQVAFAIGIIAVLYAAVQGPADGWSHPNVVAGFVAGAVVLVAFVFIETRAKTPILTLSLFKNRAFSVANLVATLAMLSFLGCCYSTSLWAGAVQHQSALRVGVLFLFLQTPPFLLIPVVSRLLARVRPQYLLAGGALVTAAGGFVAAATLRVTDTTLTPFVLPDLLIGIGGAFTISSFTAVVLGSVPPRLAGMASATINMFRDLGLALGPVVAGAIALDHAATGFFKALPAAGLPAAQLGPALGIGKAAGPLAVDSLLPGTPGSAAHLVAETALGSGFGVAWAVFGVAGIVAAAVALVGLAGVRAHTTAAEPAAEPVPVAQG